MGRRQQGELIALKLDLDDIIKLGGSESESQLEHSAQYAVYIQSMSIVALYWLSHYKTENLSQLYYKLITILI